ncbi:MAG: DUF4012 domain-containing protein [Candidatus Pacebacteria bacterium]|nr:DUF4012 domain-containing protein [Candidatus Paceibacterota bacterium]
MTSNDQLPPALVYKPTALVAGGAGFIGSFVCQSLLLQGCRVLALDNLSSGSRINLKACFTQPDFSFQEFDLNRPLEKVERADYVFHLAGMEGNQAYPLKHLVVNSQGTKNLLEYARQHQAKFLLGSSLDDFNLFLLSRSKNQRREKKILALHDEAKRFAEEMALAYFKQGLNIRIVRLGWVYGPRMNLASARGMALFLKSFVQGLPLEIPGDGEQIICPAFISDVVFGLIKAMFVSQTKGEIFSLWGPEKIKLVDLAQKIKNLSGQKLPVKFVPAKKDLADFRLLAGENQLLPGWRAKIGIDEGLERTGRFFSMKPIEGKTRLVTERPLEPSLPIQPCPPAQTKFIQAETRPNTSKPRPRLKIGFFVLVFVFLIFAMALPFSLPFFRIWSGAAELKKAYRALGEEEMAGFENKIVRSLKNFEKANQGLNQIAEVLFFLGQPEKAQKLLSMVSTIKSGAKIGNDLVLAMAKGEELSQMVLNGGPGNLDELSAELRLITQTVWRETSFLEASLQLNDLGILQNEFFNLSPLVVSLKTNLPRLRKGLSEADSFLKILPDLVGWEGEKNYLVLFQNNMELRPTGGFIGSFAQASFKKGRLVAFEVSDVYSADGQIKGHIEPPPPIKEYLGEGGWYLRDSNWDPNFPTSAHRALWFLQKALNKKADGVIAINLGLPQKILEKTGPLRLIDFREEVKAENLFEKAQSYSQDNFFPGSTQKKDFLGNLAKALLERIKESGPGKSLAILEAVYSSLEEKDLMIYLEDPHLMTTINNLSWEGSLRTLNCLDEAVDCLKDYLMIVEANLGVNKVNYYLKRSLGLRVIIDQERTFKNILKIGYLNNSSKSSPFGGDYKNYLRLYFPLGSELDQVKVGEKILSENEIDRGISAGKAYFGFLVVVPPGKELRLEVVYRPPFQAEQGKEVDYLLFLQRQSGSHPSHLKVNIELPPGASFLSANPTPAAIDRSLWFEDIFNKDLVLQTRVRL